MVIILFFLLAVANTLVPVTGDMNMKVYTSKQKYIPVKYIPVFTPNVSNDSFLCRKLKKNFI